MHQKAKLDCQKGIVGKEIKMKITKINSLMHLNIGPILVTHALPGSWSLHVQCSKMSERAPSAKFSSNKLYYFGVCVCARVSVFVVLLYSVQNLHTFFVEGQYILYNITC